MWFQNRINVVYCPDYGRRKVRGYSLSYMGLDELLLLMRIPVLHIATLFIVIRDWGLRGGSFTIHHNGSNNNR